MMTPKEKMDRLMAMNWTMQRVERTSKYRLLDQAVHAPFPGLFTALKAAVPFVVQHDWAAALASCSDVEGHAFRPPFPFTLFEFRVNDVQIAALYCAPDATSGTLCSILAQIDHWRVFGVWTDANGKWVSSTPRAEPERAEAMRTSLFGYVDRQVRAISVAIEAEVADAVPHALNAKRNARRIKNGLTPMVDYHVVKLASRHMRAPSTQADGSTRRSPRLHFRRGHWANLRGIRTWRKWALVGDPSLGFIDKHYKV